MQVRSGGSIRLPDRFRPTAATVSDQLDQYADSLHIPNDFALTWGEIEQIGFHRPIDTLLDAQADGIERDDVGAGTFGTLLGNYPVPFVETVQAGDPAFGSRI